MFVHQKNTKTSDYDFLKPKEGYLIYRKQWSPIVRKTLTGLYLIVKWINEKKQESDRVNRIILEELELPLNIPVYSLDAYFKKEFRRRKNIYYSTSRVHEDFPEPKDTYKAFIPSKHSGKPKSMSIEFFKNFNKEN